DNKEKEFPSEEDEIKISRIIKKKGNSVYKINDKTMTRTQVLDYLSSAKINPDGYNIIIQGDVTNFTSMPNEKRRKIIEEIAGIKIYEEKKQKAVNELTKVDEKLKGAEIILKEKNTHLKELKKDRDQALEYKQLNDQIRHNKAAYLKLQIEKQESRKEEFLQRKEKANKDLDEKTEKLNSLKKDNEEKKNTLNEINKEIEKRGDSEHNQLIESIQALRIEIEKDRNRIDLCKDQIEKIDEKNDQVNSNSKDNRERIAAFEKEVNNIRKELQSKEKEKEIIENSINKFKEKNKLGDDLEKIDTEIEDLDKKSEALQEELNKLRETQQNKIRDKDKQEYIIATIDESMSKVKEIEKEHKKELDDLKRKKTEFKEMSLKLNKVLNEDSMITSKLTNLKREIQDYDEEYSRLEIRNASAREAANQNEAIKQIMNNKSNLGQVYGTVGDLGNVSTEYSTALESAVGNRINSIVVEDDATASKCIKYIRQNKFGTASFIPLNKIKTVEKSQEIEKLKHNNGAIDLAINLVNFDSKFKKAFSYVLGNTLVVNDIEVARRIGIGKARMVTKDGDLAETSGLMQGGFRNKKKGRGFNEIETSKKLEVIEKRLADLRTELGRLMTQRSDNEDIIQNLRIKKAEKEGEIIKAEKALHLDNQDLNSSLKYKEEVLEGIKKLDKDIDEVQESIILKNRELAQYKIQKQQLTTKIREMRNPTVLAEINTLEEKRKSIESEINKISFNIKDIESQISIENNELENVNKILKQNDKDKENFKVEIKEKEELIKKNTSDMKEKEKKEEKYKTQFQELYKKRDKVTQDYDKNEKAIEDINEKIRKIEHILNTINLEAAGVEAKLSGLNEEFILYKDLEVKITKTEEELKKEITKFEIMKESFGSINMKALEIYDAVEKEFNVLVEKKETLSKEKDEVLAMMKEIEAKKKDIFMTTFNNLNENFKNKFQLLSSKGSAFLQLENEKDPFEAGVEVKVRIKGTKFMDLRSLSGGEKTLTALAFIFAIQENDPASFYVLDEVDAALDKNNSEKLASLVRNYCKKAQYLIISHREELYSEADQLYGVSMDETGSSKITSLKI
ncbi:hypothetical protein KY321_03445, partial [Candidatus Woesearchaeota archaeon]|nr:hypothetical protein [Candidatus Woesearchaeota archaeon]